MASLAWPGLAGALPTVAARDHPGSLTRGVQRSSPRNESHLPKHILSKTASIIATCHAPAI